MVDINTARHCLANLVRELCFSRLGGVGDLGPTRSLETAR